MPVASSHFFGCVPDPFVDHPLVDTLGSTIATEGMPERMPATKMLEAALADRRLEMACCFAGRQWFTRLAGATAAE